MKENNEKRKVKGDIYAYVNKKGFVNLAINVAGIGTLEVKLADYGSDKQAVINKKLVYKIYMNGGK